ncbi:hypothetical protein L6Q96_21655 [Candidatus Binatia bacterium]|nr:hypothetical protein [Candidatus Binatia bacterium]
MSVAAIPSRKGIKDVFYETRVLLGREYTVRRFAREALGGAIDPVMLSYIEKGKRLPSEALVRRLAALRKEDPQPLLAVLWRDRMLHAFGKELKRVLRAPQALGTVEDAELAVLVSEAIAFLPDDGSWVPVAGWRRRLRTGRRRGVRAAAPDDALVKQVEELLRARDLVEVASGKVRRLGRHFVARGAEDRQALALEFCALFAKGLLDKLALSDVDTWTYLRNHYLHIDPARLPEFQARLDAALRALVDEFSAEASASTPFLNVLVTSTTL